MFFSHTDHALKKAALDLAWTLQETILEPACGMSSSHALYSQTSSRLSQNNLPLFELLSSPIAGVWGLVPAMESLWWLCFTVGTSLPEHSAFKIEVIFIMLGLHYIYKQTLTVCGYVLKSAWSRRRWAACVLSFLTTVSYNKNCLRCITWRLYLVLVWGLQLKSKKSYDNGSGVQFFPLHLHFWNRICLHSTSNKLNEFTSLIQAR